MGMGYLPHCRDHQEADTRWSVTIRQARGWRCWFNEWNSIFNNDGTFASTVLDHPLHDAETFVIEDPSPRIKD